VVGMPRRPGTRLVAALGLAAAAPAACLRILARRRPDVALGGGGYGAGPVVVAAWVRRIARALAGAGAPLGLRHRRPAPFGQRLGRGSSIPGMNGKARVVGRSIPSTSRARSQGESRRALELPDGEPVVLVFGGSQGAQALNELAIDAWGESGPPVLHLSGERDYEALRGRVQRAG